MNQSNGILFETKNLCFQDIIQYPDLRIPSDRVNFLVGRSGSGKSTLLRLFNGTLSPGSGSIFYRGTDLEDLNTIALRREVSLISQTVYLFDCSIRENFRQFYEYREEEMPSEATMRKFLDICCIATSLDKDCVTMSGGERQRVYMAVHLSFLPKVLMLDEPTSALDEENSRSVLKNMLEFCREQNISVVIVSHDHNLTDMYGENIINLGEEGI